MSDILIIIAYIICGVVAYGAMQGQEAHDFPKHKLRDNMGIAVFMGCAGFLGFVVAMLYTDFCQHGFKFKDKDISK